MTVNIDCLTVQDSGEGVADDGDLVLFDRVELGLHLQFLSVGERCEEIFRERLSRHASYRRHQRNREKGCVSFRVPVKGEGGYELGIVEAELFTQGRSDGVFIITSRSSVRFNLTTSLRTILGTPAGLRGLDGSINVLGATGGFEEIVLTEQHAIAQAVIEQVRQIISSGLPASAQLRHSEMWLRGAEVYHDLECVDPMSVTHAAMHAAVGGMGLGQHDFYRTGVATGPVPVVHWRDKAKGEIVKIYPKTENLLRVELSCSTRDSIASVVGSRTRPAFDGEGMSTLFQEFYESAGAACCTALDFVRTLRVSTSTPADLTTALAPLLAISRRERGGYGYRPNEITAQEAGRIYNELVRSGVVSTRGLRKGMKVREALEMLSAPEGPLRRGRRRGSYSLRPELGHAALGFGQPALLRRSLQVEN